MRLFTSTTVLLLSVLADPSVSILLPTCQTQSQPNPIAREYPNDVTGTINGTVAILPISYDLARSIIPQQYGILDKQYKLFLDGTIFPKDKYPAMLQTELDHDIQSPLISVPDFSRAGILFPFVDRLGDGYTSMTYSSQILITATNPLAVAGAASYGYAVTPAVFDPPCDAYVCDGVGCPATSLSATPALTPVGGPGISHSFRSTDTCAYSLDFYKNITNQPSFSDNPAFCDNYIRLFNSSVTGEPYGIKNTRGFVAARAPFFKVDYVWKDVFAIQLDNAFIERNYVACESLKGYHV